MITMNNKFYLGVDIGQVNDPTALCILELSTRIKDKEQLAAWNYGLEATAISLYEMRHLDQWLGVSYFEQADRIYQLVSRPEIARQTAVIVDATGVGRPLVDLLRQKRIPNLVPVIITGGDAAASVDEAGYYHVSKRDLVSAMIILYESERIQMSAQLPLTPALAAQIHNFKLKIRDGRETYEAMKSDEHDDLVIALALAAWYASKDNPHEKILQHTGNPRRRAAQDWNPLQTRAR